MRSTPSPNPFDRLMGWLRLSRGEGPAWEGWARRACPPVLCSVFVFKRNLLQNVSIAQRDARRVIWGLSLR